MIERYVCYRLNEMYQKCLYLQLSLCFVCAAAILDSKLESDW